MTDEPLLRADHLTKHFKIGGALSRRMLHAVDDVSFSIGQREIVALAGESGSGKSTIARLLARVHTPTSGEVYFSHDTPAAPTTAVPTNSVPTNSVPTTAVPTNSVPTTSAPTTAAPTTAAPTTAAPTTSAPPATPLSAMRSRRARLRYSGEVPLVFQDPFASINPVFRVSHGVLRSLKLHRPDLSGRERQAEAARLFEVVGLGPGLLERYPYELSGGQRQRVGFAQALAGRARLILADEPVSMLDVSIRIGLLNLMASLRDSTGVSILYITHDIASARYVADRLIVMYAGQIAESGPIEQVLADPRHPYTQLLVSAVPDPRAPLPAAAETDQGEPPKVVDPGPGCRFRFRCPLAIGICSTTTPTLAVTGDSASVGGTREVACHVAQSGAEVKAFL